MESEYEVDPMKPGPGEKLPETLVCDWGSSRLRAYLLDGQGQVSRRHESDQGIKAITGGESAYRKALDEVLRQLEIPSEFPIRITGMAGSKKGWMETNYVPTPAGRSDLSSNFLPLSGFQDARLYGGLCHQSKDGAQDVMRGEEIQVFGVLDLHPEAQRICLPGTHSKWVTVKDGIVTGFKTYMTGDLFHSLCEHSIFKEQISSREFDQAGFLHGCRLAGEGNGLEDLFRLRTEFVFSAISETAFHSCLSGFLIANELKAADAQGTVYLCGSTALMDSYALALEQITVQCLSVDSETATIRGHQSIMQS